MKQKKNKPTRQSINVQTFLYPYKHVSQYSPHTNQTEVGSGKGKTKNESGGKQLYRPQPIKRTDIIKKGERRETEHDNQKMKKKHQLKDDRQNGETGLDEEIDEAKRKKWFIKFQKKISRTEGHAHMPTDYD